MNTPGSGSNADFCTMTLSEPPLCSAVNLKFVVCTTRLVLHLKQAQQASFALFFISVFF